MLVTDQFVFLHLHKSGGTFINRILSRFFPEARLIGYHYPRHKLPAQYQHLPIIGVVRNPWDYYVSWFSFQQQMQRPGALFQVVSDHGQREFNATITCLLNLSEDEQLFEQVSAVLPEQFSGNGINLTRNCLDQIKHSGLGFYSFLFQRMYGQQFEDVHFMRMEHLRDDCLSIMHTLKIPVSQQFIHAVQHAPKRNTSQHQHYTHYYAAELQNRVRMHDKSLIEQFHYHYL